MNMAKKITLYNNQIIQYYKHTWNNEYKKKGFVQNIKII